VLIAAGVEVGTSRNAQVIGRRALEFLIGTHMASGGNFAAHHVTS
jgi:hypothetical protein